MIRPPPSRSPSAPDGGALDCAASAAVTGLNHTTRAAVVPSDLGYRAGPGSYAPGSICRWPVAECVIMNHPYRTASEEQRPRGPYVCTCCKRPWDICVADADGGFGGQNRQRTCPACHDHGPAPMATNRVHIELWRTVVRYERQEYDAKETRLRNRISELEQELRNRPEKTVERYVDLQELDEARTEAQRAFRSRENAWQALCMVRLIHREGQVGQCRCGLRLDRCKVAPIVNHYPGLEKWEREQIRRLRNGYDHNLPDGHPAILDPRWEP